MIKTIVLIHGAWLNSLSWEHVKARYQAKGYTVIAPDWPFDDRNPNALRTNPSPDLVRIGQREIVDHYDRIIRQLAEPPILIGHSLGGVIVQQLLARGLGVAGVAINPAPTPGVPLGPQAVISALPVLGDLRSWWKVKTMSLDFFRTRFGQTIPTEQAEDACNRYIVPTPGRAY